MNRELHSDLLGFVLVAIGMALVVFAQEALGL